MGRYNRLPQPGMATALSTPMHASSGGTPSFSRESDGARWEFFILFWLFFCPFCFFLAVCMFVFPCFLLVFSPFVFSGVSYAVGTAVAAAVLNCFC